MIVPKNAGYLYLYQTKIDFKENILFGIKRVTS